MAESITITELFGVFEEIKTQYSEGLIDKTDTLEALIKVVGKHVLVNARENRNKARMAEAMTKKFADGTEIKLYWSDTLEKFITVPE